MIDRLVACLQLRARRAMEKEERRDGTVAWVSYSEWSHEGRLVVVDGEGSYVGLAHVHHEKTEEFHLIACQPHTLFSTLWME